jgi:REP element-mobilizing transposase RayT
MARLPRLVLPGIPHHITQRGNRRERTFFEDGDYALYLDLLAQAAGQARVAIWAYCLMPNHVHIIAVPEDVDGLRRTFRFVISTILAISTRTNARPGICDKAGFHRWRWMKIICITLSVTSRSIRSERGWWSGRRTGAGPGRRRIWQKPTIIWSRPRPHSNGQIISRRFWASPSMKRGAMRHCAWRSPSGDLSAHKPGAAQWRPEPASASYRRNAGRGPQDGRPNAKLLSRLKNCIHYGDIFTS